MKKNKITAENVNSIIDYYKKKYNDEREKLVSSCRKEISAVWGGTRILLHEMESELKRVNDLNLKLMKEKEDLIKQIEKCIEIDNRYKSLVINQMNDIEELRGKNIKLMEQRIVDIDKYSKMINGLHNPSAGFKLQEKKEDKE